MSEKDIIEENMNMSNERSDALAPEEPLAAAEEVSSVARRAEEARAPKGRYGEWEPFPRAIGPLRR